MTSIHSKIIRHAKKPKNVTTKEDKNQLIKIVPQLTQMLKLAKTLKQLLQQEFICSNVMQRYRRNKKYQN